MDTLRVVLLKPSKYLRNGFVERLPERYRIRLEYTDEFRGTVDLSETFASPGRRPLGLEILRGQLFSRFRRARRARLAQRLRALSRRAPGDDERATTSSSSGVSAPADGCHS